MLSSNETSNLVNISITNDDIFELTESFMVNLSFGTLVPGVILGQTVAEIIIIDDDGEKYLCLLHLQHQLCFLL